MAKLEFTTTGEALRIVRFEAFAFHDAAGRIHHMHHSIVLEGAEPRPPDVVLAEVREQALALGNDIGKLSVLHVKEPFNPQVQHRVDIGRGALVELVPPKRPSGKRPAAKQPKKKKKATKNPRRKVAKKRRRKR